MSELIYIIDPATKKPTPVSSVTFDDIGIRERQDLESWVVAHPDILGEELLLLTSEFDRFDNASRRLDVLALDKEGTLVVIELKLDLSNTFADQQAIRYAAFCSTMTMDDAVEAFAAYKGFSKDEAVAQVKQFLGVDELPELDDRPRIILAAGSLDDQELTATVLWLRSFGIDISCIELTTYRLPESGLLILVPKIIIPLPEAKEYIIRVQKKESAKARSTGDPLIAALWASIAKGFNALGLQWQIRPRQSGNQRIGIGHADMHYEWTPLKSKSLLRVAVHFESDDRDLNLERLAAIGELKGTLEEAAGRDFFVEPWGERWATAEFRIGYEDAENPAAIAPTAVRVMKLLIDHTWPTLKVLMDAKGNGKHG